MLRLGLVLVALTAALAGPAAAADDFHGFRSPTGNIGCFIDARLGARCDIAQHSWATPPHPSWCHEDYGQGLSLDRSGRASFVCAGDTALNIGPRLAYGRSITAGVFTCRSARSGMTCRNRRTGHGFSLSRARYRLW